MTAKPSQQLARKISQMDRKALTGMLRNFRCSFELDFTDEFLNSVSLSRLRHIVMGISLHSRNRPSAGRRKSSA